MIRRRRGALDRKRRLKVRRFWLRVACRQAGVGVYGASFVLGEVSAKGLVHCLGLALRRVCVGVVHS